MNYLIDLYNNPNIFLNLPTLYQKKKYANLRGNLFEKYIKIIILFDKFKDYQLLDKNFKVIKDKFEYLKTHKVQDSCAEGLYDIKLLDKYTNQYFFISCKYYAKEKTLDYYDILEMAETIKGRPNTIIGLFIKNKTEFVERYKYSRNNIIKKYINLDNVYDYDYFKQLFIDLINNKKDNTLKIFDVNIFYQDLINQLKFGNNIILDCVLNNQIKFIQSVILSKHIKNTLIIYSNNGTTLKWELDNFNQYYDFDLYDISIINRQEDIKNNNKNHILIINYDVLKNNYKLLKNEYQLITLDNFDKMKEIKPIINKFKPIYKLYFYMANYSNNYKSINTIRYTEMPNKLIV